MTPSGPRRHADDPDRPAVAPAPDDPGRKYLALTITWFGSLAYNQMPAEPDPEGDAVRLCGVCDSKIPLASTFAVEPAADRDPPDRDAQVADPDDWSHKPQRSLSWQYGAAAREHDARNYAVSGRPIDWGSVPDLDDAALERRVPTRVYAPELIAGVDY